MGEKLPNYTVRVWSRRNLSNNPPGGSNVNTKEVIYACFRQLPLCLFIFQDLTYKIVNYTPDNIPRYKQRQIFQEAMRKWEAASGLRIRQVYRGEADIPISFVTRNHGDGYAFDGQGGTLAHAFYPHNNEGTFLC